MFGFGPWEIAMIVGAVLLVAGPTLLPRLGIHLARTFTGLRDGAEAFNQNLRAEMDDAEISPAPELPEGEVEKKVGA